MRLQPCPTKRQLLTISVLTLGGGLLSARATAQMITPLDQTRTISGAAAASDDFYYESFDDSDVAPDLAPFDVSTAVNAVVSGADSSGSAWQTSSIGGDVLTASGGTAADGEGWSDNGWGRGDGDSVFRVTFDLAAAATARVIGTLEAYDTASDSGYAEAILVGPSGGVFAELAFGPSDVVDFDQVLHLPAGEYTLNVFADAHTYGDVPTGLGEASASYDVTFSVCLASDLDGDGLVGLSDLAVLLANYGAVGGPAEGDLNDDGVVSLTDLATLLSDYGQSCNQ
jgi:hypothetical protein